MFWIIEFLDYRTTTAISQKGPDSICCRLQRIDTVKLLKIYETRCLKRLNMRLKLLNIVLSAKMDDIVKLFKNLCRLKHRNVVLSAKMVDTVNIFITLVTGCLRRLDNLLSSKMDRSSKHV